ncbi:MAG: XdhC family protein [Chloroflexi bacterium]|nr:XdhC family protein [Chloroflexota bacterium]
MVEIYQAILEAKAAGQPALLATVVSTSGSVPRHAGSKMLIGPGDSLTGTVGGGEMESRVIEAAPAVIARGEPTVMTFNLVAPERGDPGVCGGQVEIFMEPILPDPTVLVIGAGHCGQALAELAHWVGYRVVVTDDRPELCNPEVIPHADAHIVIPPAAVSEEIPIHSRTYVAAVTRGVPLDVAMLPGLLDTPAAYIGVMGSKRRWSAAVKELREAGVTEDSLSRIHAPIGLELNAETPRQIAVSIMAEIIAVQRGGTGKPMKEG